MNLGQFIEHFHWLRPLWLLAIPLLLGITFLLFRSREQGHAHSALLAPHLARYLIIPAQQPRIFNPLNGLLLAACVAALALAGPTWRQQASPLSEDEAVLIIALDVSSSMQQADVQPSRLERAKQKIQDLLELRAGARSGLIVFSGSAHSVLPPTNDRDLMLHFLNAVQAEMMPRQGKAAANIIPIANTMLEEAVLGRSDIPGTVLLISDQVDTPAQDALSQMFKNSHHQLIVWGIGVPNTGSTDNNDGNYLPLDSGSLESLADAANGYYQTLSTDISDAHRINWRIENHLLFVEDEQRPWQDMGYYLVWPLLLLGLLWFRRGWALPTQITQLSTPQSAQQSTPLAISLLAIVPLLFPAATEAQQPAIEQEPAPRSFSQSFVDVWFTRDQQARFYFERGNYKKAAGLYQQPMSRGVALYLSEEFNAAADVFASLGSDTALFNQGNALAHGRHYVKAVGVYTQLLNRSPNYPGVAKNRALVQALIDANNQMSESQQAEAGELELAQEINEQAQSGDGAEQISWQEQQAFSAEQILTDERIQQQWMKQVQQDPARFLAVKFQMQANSQSANNSNNNSTGNSNE